MDNCKLKKGFTAKEIAIFHGVPIKYAREQLVNGTIHELEHSTNNKTAMIIASQHLRNESLDYYKELAKMEAKFESGGEVQTGYSVIDEIVDATDEYREELANKTIDKLIQNGEFIPVWLKESIKLGYILDLVSALSNYIAKDDKLIDLDFHKSKGLIEISSTIERGGETHFISTEMIYAGGYNVQRLHFRYLVHTKLPHIKNSIATKGVEEKIKKLKAKQSINDKIKNQTQRVIELNAKILDDENKAKTAELKSDVEIWGIILKANEYAHLYDDASYNYALANFNESYMEGFKSEGEWHNETKKQKADLIKRWKNTNIENPKANAAYWKADIKKINKRIEKLKTESGENFEGGGEVAINPAFKKWFDGSKVVDEQGNPLIVYHGTPSEKFERFDFTKPKVHRKREDIGGVYFTIDKQVAYNYTNNRKVGVPRKGHVVSAYLKINNPLDITEPIKKLRKKGLSFSDAKEEALKMLDKTKHDGVIFRGNNYNAAEYAVFSPSQIKLATGENTTFDGNNPDIRFESGGSVTTNEGRKGGELDGDLHSAPSGGIKAIVTDAGNKEVLLESSEIIINRKSSQCPIDKCSHTFDGKERSNKEILSLINQEAGGVPIGDNDSDKFELGGEINKQGFINYLIDKYTFAELENKMVYYIYHDLPTAEGDLYVFSNVASSKEYLRNYEILNLNLLQQSTLDRAAIDKITLDAGTSFRRFTDNPTLGLYGEFKTIYLIDHNFQNIKVFGKQLMGDGGEVGKMTEEEFIKNTISYEYKNSYGRNYQLIYVGYKSNENFKYYKDELNTERKKSLQEQNSKEIDKLEKALEKESIGSYSGSGTFVKVVDVKKDIYKREIKKSLSPSQSADVPEVGNMPTQSELSELTNLYKVGKKGSYYGKTNKRALEILLNAQDILKRASKVDQSYKGQLEEVERLVGVYKRDLGIIDDVPEAVEKGLGGKDNQSISFKDVKEGDYVEVHGYSIEAKANIKLAEGLVTFKYGNNYLNLDNNNGVKYNYGYTYYIKDKPETTNNNHSDFVNRLIADSKAGVLYNKTKLENVAKGYGITEQNLAKELAELSISILARQIASNGEPLKERYDKIVSLYKTQVSMSHRTSESILLQQYSTPAPIGFIAGIFCGFDKGGNFFEPSAGNGLLTIAGDVKDFMVNEIDDVRNNNLKAQGFGLVLKQDASLPFHDNDREFDAVITNPPFGSTEAVQYGKTDIKSLEQLMCLRALDCMKNNGRAALIIGGHTLYDSEGRIQAGKNRSFFVYLYKHYNVEDVINIDGHALYSRQGTAFNTRLILISGRKEKPSGFPPLIEKPMGMDEIESPTPVNDFDVLFKRVMKSMDGKNTTSDSPITKQDYENTIAGLQTMLEFVEGDERQQYLDTIEGLETMLELMN